MLDEDQSRQQLKQFIRRQAFAEAAKFLREKALLANNHLDASLLLAVSIEVESLK